MKTSFLNKLILFLCVTTFFGCATLFAPITSPVSLNSDPDQSDVYVNGFKMGSTPLKLELKADKSYTIEFRKKGYSTVIRVINTKIGGGYLVLDILGGLIPLLIDASTGAWNKFDQDTVNAVLIEQKM